MKEADATFHLLRFQFFKHVPGKTQISLTKVETNQHSKTRLSEAGS